MDNDVKVLERIYDRFNARDIEGVLTVLTDDVAWYGWWPRPWPRGRTRVLDAPVDHGQSARRACGLSSNCGWRDHEHTCPSKKCQVATRWRLEAEGRKAIR